MKVEIKLEAAEVRTAIANYVTKVLRMNCTADDVQSSAYSWETPKIIIDVQDPTTQEDAATTNTNQYF
jgi:hypothetical protein